MLDPGELAVLAELCTTLDELERFNAEAAAAPLLVTGSRGQPVPNPIFGQILRHRKVAESLEAALALPAPGESVGRRRSVNAQRAAHARWRGGRGA